MERLGERRASLARGAARAWGCVRSTASCLHLPNGPEFIYLYFALQKIGVVPILALAPHRRARDRPFRAARRRGGLLRDRPRTGRAGRARRNPCSRARRDARTSSKQMAGDADAPALEIDPDDPCCPAPVGRNDRHPQAHTPHPQRLHLQLASRPRRCKTSTGKLPAVRAAAGAQHAAGVPGRAGIPDGGARIVVGTSTRRAGRVRARRAAPRDARGRRARPLHPLDGRPRRRRNTTSARSAFCSRADSACSRRCRKRMAETFPNAFVQENFGMSEGTALLRAARRPRGGAPRDRRAAGQPRRRGAG